MTVTVNATATTPTQASSGATVTNTTLTIASGATALLALVAVSFGNDPTAVHWDSTGTNQAMTKIANVVDGSSSVFVSLWGLLSPTVGNKTLSATGLAGQTILDAIAFNGTDTGSLANAFKNANANSGSGTSYSVTGTSAVGNINVGLIGNTATTITSWAATSSTSIFFASNNNGGAAARAPGAASVAWTGSAGFTDSWGAVCIDVSAPAAATFTPVLPAQHSPPQRRGGSAALFMPAMAAPVSTSPETVTEDRWHQPLSTPLLRLWTPASQQATFWSGFTPAPATPISIGWFAPFSDPVRRTPAAQPGGAIAPVSESPETVSVDRWLQQLSNPVLRPWTPAAAFPAEAWSGFTPNVVPNFGWFRPLSDPTRNIPAARPTSGAVTPISEAPETVSVDRWLQPFSIPTRRPWTPAVLPALAWSTFTPAVVTPVSLSWFSSFSQPRFYPGEDGDSLSSPILSASPETTTVDRWYQPFSQPVVHLWSQRDARFIAWSTYTPAATTLVSIGWFQPFSVPARRIQSPVAQNATAWGIYTPSLNSIYYDVSTPSGYGATVRVDYSVPLKQNAGIVVPVGHAPVEWTASIRGDASAPIEQISSVVEDNSSPTARATTSKVDFNTPISWAGTSTPITGDWVSPLSWGGAARRDTSAASSFGANTRVDYTSPINWVGSTVVISGDWVAPLAWGSKSVRTDLVSPLAEGSAVKADYKAPMSWAGSANSVTTDWSSPISWASRGQREDITAPIGWNAGIRKDAPSPVSTIASFIKDAVSPVERTTALRSDSVVPTSWAANVVYYIPAGDPFESAFDAPFGADSPGGTPLAFNSAVKSDVFLPVAWSGYTFSTTSNYNSPIGWFSTARTDVNTPLSWAAGSNPISGDWLSPISWGSATRSDVLSPTLRRAAFNLDYIIPAQYKLTARYDVNIPAEHIYAVTRRDVVALFYSTDVERVDYTVPISWAHTLTPISGDVLLPIAWNAATYSDYLVGTQHGAPFRRDVLIPLRTAANEYTTFSHPVETLSSVKQDTTAPVYRLHTSIADYKAPVYWTGSTYVVNYNVLSPLGWGASIRDDYTVKVSTVAPIIRDQTTPMERVASNYSTAPVPIESAALSYATALVPFYWNQAVALATHWDLSSPLAWVSSIPADIKTPLGYAVTLGPNAMSPIAWSGQPFVPWGGRTIHGPGNMRKAIP